MEIITTDEEIARLVATCIIHTLIDMGVEDLKGADLIRFKNAVKSDLPTSLKGINKLYDKIVTGTLYEN